MLVEILGGALLGAALKKKRGTDKILTESLTTKDARYAVLSEVLNGKGAGAVSVSFITTDKTEAVAWMNNAAKALQAAMKHQAIIHWFDASNYGQQYVDGVTVKDDMENEIQFFVIKY